AFRARRHGPPGGRGAGPRARVDHAPELRRPCGGAEPEAKSVPEGHFRRPWVVNCRRNPEYRSTQAPRKREGPSNCAGPLVILVEPKGIEPSTSRVRF